MFLFTSMRARVYGIAWTLVLIAVASTSCNSAVNTAQQGASVTGTQKPNTSYEQSTYTPRVRGRTTQTPYEPSSGAGDPYCNPPDAEIWLTPTSTSVGVGEPLRLDLLLRNPESSDAFMGQIMYRIDILPELFEGERVAESDKTLYPGESDMASFELVATKEGKADLIAKASYELHAVDVSWGSWTGCASLPIKVEVVAGQGATSVLDTTVQIHEPSTRTGIPGVDIVLDAVLTRDQEAIKDLIRYSISACTNEMGLGGPPKCREGEPVGTMVEVLPFLGPEGHFLRRDEVRDWSGLDIKGLYAVYLVSEQAFADPDYPAGEYAAVFLHGHGISFVTLQIDNGAIIRIDNQFGYPPDEQLMKDASQVITPPKSDQE